LETCDSELSITIKHMNKQWWIEKI
jgi:hypothetical protein